MSVGPRRLVRDMRSAASSTRQWTVAHWRVIAFASIVLLFLANALTYFGWGQDDPGILFRYAVNLAEGHGLVYNPGENVEGFSDFGYVILMSVAYKALGLSGRPEVLFVVSKFVGLLCSVAALFLTYRLATRSLAMETPWAFFACLLLAASAPFAIWSVGGLETNCLVCVLLAALVLYLRYLELRPQATSGSSALRVSLLCGLSLALMTLLRADGFIFAGIVGAHWLFVRLRSRDLRRVDWPVVLLPLFALVTYEIWRLWYYGYPLPNSYYAKVQPSLSLQDIATTFESYVKPYLDTLGGPGLVLALVAIAAYKDAKHTSRFIAVLCVAFVAYVIAVGGDWMAAYRFLVPVVPLLLLLVVSGARHAVGALALRLPRPSLGVVLSLLAASIIAAHQIHQGTWMIRGWKEDFTPWYAHPTLDARKLVPYGDIAAWISEHSDSSAVLATHQAGFIPFLTGLHTIDTFGITDSALAHMIDDPYAVRKDRAGIFHYIGAGPPSTPAGRYIMDQRPDLYVVYTRWDRKLVHGAQYLAGGEYVLLETDLYGFDVYVPAGGSPRVLVNVASLGNASTSFSSNYDPSATAGNVFHGGTWTSGCNDEAWVQSTFERPFLVETIAVAKAGTDVTTDESLMEFMLLDPDGSCVTVASLTEKNINWDSANDGAVLNSVPEYRLKLPDPRLATGFRLHLRGHGWFLASDIQVLGRAAPSK